MIRKLFLLSIMLIVAATISTAQPTTTADFQRRLKSATKLYTNGAYKEAFEQLRFADQAIVSAQQLTDSDRAALRYQTARERMRMYMKMRRSVNVAEQLNIMEAQAITANNDSVNNDLLYNKAIYCYTFGQVDEGNILFQQMADKLTANGDNDKMEEAFKTLIATGRNSGNVHMVNQAYTNYIEWKDSVSAQQHADEVDALNQEIANGKAAVAERDDKLGSRQAVIIGLIVLLVVLTAALALGAVVLLRFIVLTRKQKNTIRQAHEDNAQKAHFISNISAQLTPTLQLLDNKQPAVKALLNFTDHIQTLADLDRTDAATDEPETVQIQPLCDDMLATIRQKVKPDVTLTVDAPKMSVTLVKPYVTHILQHLLNNAAEHTPNGGHISLGFKKRGPHKYQFLVQNTGDTIPEESRENIFKPFREVKDLTTGDGLGLPICKQMALKMNGDLDIDPAFTKGTRFVLHLEG